MMLNDLLKEPSDKKRKLEAEKHEVEAKYFFVSDPCKNQMFVND